MARRRRKTKGLMGQLDWNVDPQTTREIFAVLFILLGVLFLLSIFNAAGSVGHTLLLALKNIFGLVGYLVPLVLIVLGLFLFSPSRVNLKPLQIAGLVLCFIFIPALLSPFGGNVGASVILAFKNAIGAGAAILVLFALTIVALLMAFNTSIKNLWQRLGVPSGQQAGQIKTSNGSVSVFTTVKRKIGLNGKDKGEAPGTVAVGKDASWNFPPLDLLRSSDVKATSGNIPKNVDIIKRTLTDFGMEVAMGDVHVGPTVTQYTLRPAEGVKLANIVARTNDLSLSLAAHPIRIEAPIPGKSAVGIEVPNKVPAEVTLRSVLDSDEFKGLAKQSNLTMALGMDVSGRPIAMDLAAMPHLLLAGATGSGKTIGLHSIICSLLYQNTPSNLKLILVDPKRVEFTHHNGIAHLLVPVITEIDQTISALRWSIAEMERRFKLFSETHHRNITEYNQNTAEKLPFIIICIDELADLMAQAANEVEAAVVRLAQMARATGIHLIVATQRPSVDVITGLIKANITARIAFAVASQVDSRTILDLSGAEKLLGRGDMLFLASDIGKPKRIQGCLITSEEIKKVTDFIRQQGGPATYDEEILNFRPAARGIGKMALDDDLFADAKDISIQAGKASASLLQRRLRIGYARAARLLDLLEQEGIIGPADGAKPRDVLVSDLGIHQNNDREIKE